MLNAKEARKRTDEGNREKLKLKRNNSYSAIENLIIDAASKGENQIEYADYFDEEMFEKMESLGYDVTYESNIAIIKW